MRIVYFGTAPFAVPALRMVAGNVVAVVTQPDKPTGRGMEVQPSPVKRAAIELGLRVESPRRCRAPESVEMLKSIDADMFLVAAYGQILSKEVLDIPRAGCFNLHGSILPRWRGAAPVQRAVEAGDILSGVTLMRMDEGMDTGDMIAVAEAPIGPDQTAGELYGKLSVLAAELASSWIGRLAAGEFVASKQDETQATHAWKVSKEDAEVMATLELHTAYNRYRAFTPAPGAFLRTPYGKLKITKAGLSQMSGQKGGEIITVRPELVVALPGGGLVLEEVQPEGRKRMSGTDFANGARLGPGMRLLD